MTAPLLYQSRSRSLVLAGDARERDGHGPRAARARALTPRRRSPGLPRRALCACRRVAAESLGSFLEGAGLPLARCVESQAFNTARRSSSEAALLV